MPASTLHSEWLQWQDETFPTLVCLHGFTGTLNTFQNLTWPHNWNVLGVDLIGYGQSPIYVHPDEYRMSRVIQNLKKLMLDLRIAKYTLLGYSMGGRVALAWALNDPKVVRVILESSRPGIADDRARQERQVKDNQLARRLLTQPLLNFVNDWENLPLFATQRKLPAIVQDRVRQERLSQVPYGLAMSLMMMGTGQQTNYWPQLSQICPGLLITGDADNKFQRIAMAMQTVAPQLQHQELSGGHCVHLENPLLFSQTVINYLNH